MNEKTIWVMIVVILFAVIGLYAITLSTPEPDLQSLLITHTEETLPLEQVLIYLSTTKLDEGYGIFEVNYQGKDCILTYVVHEEAVGGTWNWTFAYDLECLP